MTKELAIRIITGDVLGTSEQTQEAVTMAVKALSMSDVPDKNVGGTISRQAAIDALTEEKEMINAVLDSLTLDYNARRNQEQRRGRINEDIETIKALSPAQPEIIACGDCKHWICHDRRCGFWNHGVKPLDWCCHAERRTDETD